MAVNSKLNFDIFARDNASPVFNKFGKQVDQTGKKMGGASGATKKLLGAFAGLAVVSKVSGFLKDANTEARESQKVNALTANALKTTGAAAWASTNGIGAMATAMSNKTGVDDEAIQSGANLLLTFKNVQNAAGAGSKIFDRATAAAVDLSASGFGSITGASKMLGKALNDPVKGITALSRAGVTFTEGQKKQIAAMVAAGDTLGAQKIILKEVESQVKGSAAAQATAADKLKVSWANFQELVGTKLLPILDKMAIAGTKAIAWLSKNPGALKALAAALGVLAIAFIAVQVAAFAIPLAIAAVVAGLVFAFTKFEWFRKGVQFVFKAISAYAKFMWNNVYQPILNFLVLAIGKTMVMFGKMLSGMSRVPGFGWAKKAGDAMQNAGEKAQELGDKIKKIPDAKVRASQTGFQAVIDMVNKMNAAVRKSGGRVRFTTGRGGSGGIPQFAHGTNFAPGGWAKVGELGPEIVNLPRGSQVFSNAKSKQMVQGASAGGITITQNIHPQPQQSEIEIGRASANALQFAMAR